MKTILSCLIVLVLIPSLTWARSEVTIKMSPTGWPRYTIAQENSKIFFFMNGEILGAEQGYDAAQIRKRLKGFEPTAGEARAYGIASGVLGGASIVALPVLILTIIFTHPFADPSIAPTFVAGCLGGLGGGIIGGLSSPDILSQRQVCHKTIDDTLETLSQQQAKDFKLTITAKNLDPESFKSLFYALVDVYLK